MASYRLHRIFLRPAALILSGMAAWLLVSCGATGPSRAGRSTVDPVRFSTWEDYYERGRQSMLEGRLQAAREDFETCLGVRAGARRSNPRDAWRVRTYGMHMFDGYFPNRELGICLYHLGDLPAARDYLARSLEQTPTSRAAHFLGRVRLARLEGTAVAPPRIALQAEDAVLTRDRTYAVEGVAYAAAGIAGIRVNGVPLISDAAEVEQAFSHALPLEPGENRIVVEVVDLRGVAARAEHTVHADWTPPAVSLLSTERTRAGRRFVLACEDSAALALVQCNGRSLLGPSGTRYAECAAEVAAGEPARMTVADVAGNEAAVDLWSMSDAVSGSRPPDGTGPVILLDDERDLHLVHRDFFYLEGRVDAGAGFKALELNQTELAGAGRAGARSVRFSSFCRLAPGTNVLTLAAGDLLGRTQTRRLTVVRRAPDYARKAYRLAASVPPLYASRDPADGAAWQHRVVEALLRPEPARFNLLSVAPADLDGMLTEWGLQRMALVDPRARIDYSRFNPADLSFNGLAVHHREGVELRFHLLDTSTGERHGYVDVYIDDADPDPGRTLDGLAAKIERHYPVTGGRLTDVQGGRVALDAGRRDGLRDWGRFLVVRPGADGTLHGGTVLTGGGRPVELALTACRAEDALARVREPRDAGLLVEGDFFHAR